MSNGQIKLDPTREEIINAAKSLIAQYGYKKTTMDDIAKKVGKSKSALYYYYKTKEEIFEVGYECDSQCQIEAICLAIDAESTAEGKIKALIKSMLDAIVAHAKTYPLLKNDILENPMLFIELARKKDHSIEKILKDVLIFGIASGEISYMTSDEMDVWAKAINFSLHTIGAKIFFGDAFEASEKNIEFLSRSIVHGIVKK